LILDNDGAFRVGKLEHRTFLLLTIIITLGFGMIVWPFFGAILWGIAAAIVFRPLNERLLKFWPGRRNLAALSTLIIIMALVILPAVLIATFLAQEALALYARVQVTGLDIGQSFEDFRHGLPYWVVQILDRLGLANVAGVQSKLSAGVAGGLQEIAGRLLNIGQGAAGFIVALVIMLYLTFFFLRDGKMLIARIGHAIPLADHQRDALFDKFVTVIRATIKGSLVVATLQGTLGGLIFWVLGIHAPLLWGVMMGFFSLLPAVGTGIIWVPVTIYLLVTGAIWQGAVLGLCGFFVIGMVDNVLRPILVGKDTRLPDYVVLLSTLGGVQMFGINGLIIGPVIAAMFLAVWEIFPVSQSADQHVNG
jgi:predicted PurR-regulated permease PerM